RTGRIERIRAALNPDINKTWIDDGVRFGHEYTSAEDRLRTPLVRKDGVLEPASWSEAAEFIAQKLRTFGPGETGVAIRADSTLVVSVGVRDVWKQLRTGQLVSVPRPALSVLSKFRVKAAPFTELVTAVAVLVIGDPTEEVPIVALRIRDALK